MFSRSKRPANHVRMGLREMDYYCEHCADVDSEMLLNFAAIGKSPYFFRFSAIMNYKS